MISPYFPIFLLSYAVVPEDLPALGPCAAPAAFSPLGTLNALLLRGYFLRTAVKFSKYNVNDISGNAKKKRPEPNGHSFPMIQVASDLLINYVPDTEFILFKLL